ncbi:hypothetical protein DSUL_90044 [Desulfovibrionales bacterium]
MLTKKNSSACWMLPVLFQVVTYILYVDFHVFNALLRLIYLKELRFIRFSYLCVIL